MSEPRMEAVVLGDGYAASCLDDIGEGFGFRKVRSALGVEAYGVNALVIPPRYDTGAHRHKEQEELYFVHEGDVELVLHESAVVPLGPGGVARVEPQVVRRLRNVGSETAVVLVMGGKGGYVGRDGLPAEGDTPPAGPIDA